MKRESNIRKSHKALFLAIGTCLITFLVLFANATIGQMKNTEHQPDKNLKSSARVNPSTLAMEFSIPLANYPGRGSNAVPVTLSYSSKLWHRKTYSPITRERYTQGDLPPWDIITTYNSMARFGRRSISGWTSSLQAPAIIKELEIYNQSGQLHSFSPEPVDEFQCSSSALPGSIRECFSGYEMNSTCGSGVAWFYRCFDCGDNYCWEDLDSSQYECLPQLPGGGWPLPTPNPFPTPVPTPIPSPTPELAYIVRRIRVHMPDGSSQEFRKDDGVHGCANPFQCQTVDGSYLSVNGTGMVLRVGDTSIDPEGDTILYTQNGTRYVFPDSAAPSTVYLQASYVIDRNGNRSEFNAASGTWTDTLGRTVDDPLPNPLNHEFAVPGTREFTLPGYNDEHKIVWKKLRPDGCDNGNEPICEDSVMEDSGLELKYLGNDTCQDALPDNPIGPSLFSIQPTEQWAGANAEAEHFTKERICATTPYAGHGAPPNPPLTPLKFNPTVMAELHLPNGERYTFRYNEYGEITKIIYPTGAYERFRYEAVMPIGGAVDQTNRGVVEHWISEDGTNVTQHWTFAQEPRLYGGIPVFEMTTNAPDGSKSVRLLRLDASSGHYGFSSPLAGMPIEEKTYDTGGVLRKRVISDWTVKPSPGPHENAARDPRVKRSVSMVFEPGASSALTTLSVNEYDETGSTDPEFFSHLNVKRTLGYHYATVNPAQAADESLSWSTIESWFPATKVASATQTDYLYEGAPTYKERGILGLAFRTLTLNPVSLDQNYPLSKAETVYDDAYPAAPGTYSYPLLTYATGNSMDCSSDPQSPKICWQNPNGAGGINLSHRGLPTTTRVWHAERGSWIETHVQYDQFGNAVKGKDPIDNETTTEFSSVNKYAYPTKLIAPAPDPDNTGHGTNQTSTVETSYDFWTGLPLTVKDDFGQITRTQYDNSLRPWRVYGENFTTPETQTIYGTPDVVTGQLPPGERFVKVRKQIDATNWDEATTWFDGLGRTIKTQAKDSQGDVFVETAYDNMGRVARVTNPYRNGDTIYWSKTRYEAGRAVETYAPTELANLANAQSLGLTSFDISNVTGFVGTVVTTTDASGRKGRSITNALGQLLRVDEPTSFGGTETQDLGPIDSPYQPTVYTFDIAGKMVRVQQGAQDRFFKYDSLGRLIRVKQPEQESNAGLAMSDPYNTTWQWTAGFSYDTVGNVLTATDANGVTITNSYDKAGRVTTRTYSGEPAGQTTPTVTFVYDGRDLGSQPPSPNFAKGKLTKVENTVSQTRYTVFDNFGRLKQMEQRTPVEGELIENATPRVSKYTYNFAGALIEEEYPSGRVVKNAFESDGDLLTVTSKKAGSQVFTQYASNFSYTASGGISQMRLGNGKWETAKFNSRLQVTELGLGSSASDGSAWKVNYDYGELDDTGTLQPSKNTGNIAKQTLWFAGLANPLVQAYRYDSLYRLKEAKETSDSSPTPNWTQNFDYDRYGNRISFSQNIAGTVTNGTPSISAEKNRFNTGQGFGYDKNGNVITDVDGATGFTRDFIFNGDNKQKEVKVSGATIAKYFYDGEGKRVKKQLISSGVMTEETVFVYSAGKLVAEYSTNISQQPSINYTTTDHLGSPRVITNQLGQVISRRDFMPFGEELISAVGARIGNPEYSSVDNVRQKFTGYQKDNETRLDFAEARMYENRYGRFTAVDPLLASGKSANPQTFNRYIYVGNNPIAVTDPLGLTWYYNQSIGKYNWFDEETQRFKWGGGELTADWSLARDCIGEGCFVYEKDGGWITLDPGSSNFTPWATSIQAQWEYGALTNYGGYGNIPILGTFGYPMVSGIKTGNVDRAMYGFWGTAVSLATVPRTLAGILKEGATEAASSLSGLPVFNPTAMFSMRSADGLERASDGLLDLIGKKRNLVFARPGSDELRMLDKFGAEASMFRGTDTILLRENPSKVAALEEFLHGTQNRLGIVDRLGGQGAEIHVNQFMLRHKSMLNLTPAEVKNIEATVEQIKRGIF